MIWGLLQALEETKPLIFNPEITYQKGYNCSVSHPSQSWKFKFKTNISSTLFAKYVLNIFYKTVSNNQHITHMWMFTYFMHISHFERYMKYKVFTLYLGKCGNIVIGTNRSHSQNSSHANMELYHVYFHVVQYSP